MVKIQHSYHGVWWCAACTTIEVSMEKVFEVTVDSILEIQSIVNTLSSLKPGPSSSSRSLPVRFHPSLPLPDSITSTSAEGLSESWKNNFYLIKHFKHWSTSMTSDDLSWFHHLLMVIPADKKGTLTWHRWCHNWREIFHQRCPDWTITYLSCKVVFCCQIGSWSQGIDRLGDVVKASIVLSVSLSSSDESSHIKALSFWILCWSIWIG